HAVADRPAVGAFADGVNHTHHVVTRHPAILNTGHEPLLGDCVAVAHTACLPFDAHLDGNRHGNGPFNHLNRRVGGTYLGGTHNGRGSSRALHCRHDFAVAK